MFFRNCIVERCPDSTNTAMSSQTDHSLERTLNKKKTISLFSLNTFFLCLGHKSLVPTFALNSSKHEIGSRAVMRFNQNLVNIWMLLKSLINHLCLMLALLLQNSNSALFQCPLEDQPSCVNGSTRRSIVPFFLKKSKIPRKKKKKIFSQRSILGSDLIIENNRALLAWGSNQIFSNNHDCDTSNSDILLGAGKDESVFRDVD